jgi:hypothetical protein
VEHQIVAFRDSGRFLNQGLNYHQSTQHYSISKHGQASNVDGLTVVRTPVLRTLENTLIGRPARAVKTVIKAMEKLPGAGFYTYPLPLDF